MAVWDGWLEALIAPLVQETPLAAELRRQPLPLWQAARVWAVTERVWAAAEGDGAPDAPPAGCADGKRS